MCAGEGGVVEGPSRDQRCTSLERGVEKKRCADERKIERDGRDRVWYCYRWAEEGRYTHQGGCTKYNVV